MSKKLVIGLAAGILVAAFVLPVSVAAADAAQSEYEYSSGRGGGDGWGGYSGGGMGALMWDEDGNFLDRDAYEDKLDDAVADGYIFAEDKDNFLDMYDFCADNGNLSGYGDFDDYRMGNGYGGYGGCWGGGYGGCWGDGYGGGNGYGGSGYGGRGYGRGGCGRW